MSRRRLLILLGAVAFGAGAALALYDLINGWEIAVACVVVLVVMDRTTPQPRRSFNRALFGVLAGPAITALATGEAWFPLRLAALALTTCSLIRAQSLFDRQRPPHPT